MTYNKYGLASIEAVKLINEVRTLTAEKDWDIATEKIFGKSKPSQLISCPRSTFLAICEAGRIKGIKPGGYTR